MIWLLAIPVVWLAVRLLRAHTQPPTPDRRPGEITDVSRERLRAIVRAYECDEQEAA